MPVRVRPEVPPLLTGNHLLNICSFTNLDWRVSDKVEIIRIDRLAPIIKELEPVLVHHDEISWKYMADPKEKKRRSKVRYYHANVMIPGILAEVPNPHNLKYRLIDGAHRMCKLKLETNFTKSMFYIISAEDFYNLLEDLPAEMEKYAHH